MSFAFGKNEEPLDLSKGGDALPGQQGTNASPPTGSTNRQQLPPIPGRTVPVAPQPARAPLPTPPSRVTPPAPPKQEVPAFKPPVRDVAPARVSPPTRVTPPTPKPYIPEEDLYDTNTGDTSGQYSYEEETQDYDDYRENESQRQVYREEYPEPRERAPRNTQRRPTSSPEANEFFNPKAIEQKAEEPVKLDKKGKPVKSKKVKKVSQFAGDRRKVLIARITVFSILGILVFSGLASFLPKSSGLTASDGPLIISKVRQNLGVTDFPRTSGEGMALGFSKTYLNYDPDQREARSNELKNYATEGILSQIDIRPATGEELLAAASVTASNNAAGATDENGQPITTNVTATGKQIVTDGPYLVKSTMIQYGEAAVFTTKTEINDSKWIYMEVPMFYDKNTGSLAVSGSPTFANDISVANVPENQYSYSWTGDREIEGLVKDDLANYMKAWAASDTTTLDRLTIKKDGKNVATPAALGGLNGTVQLVRVGEFSVEQKKALTDDSTSEERTNFNTRQAQMTVIWLEPSSGMVYSQTYRMVLQYANDDWFVSDIENVTTLIDREALEEQKAANPSSTEAPSPESTSDSQ